MREPCKDQREMDTGTANSAPNCSAAVSEKLVKLRTKGCPPGCCMSAASSFTLAPAVVPASDVPATTAMKVSPIEVSSVCDVNTPSPSRLEMSSGPRKSCTAKASARFRADTTSASLVVLEVVLIKVLEVERVVVPVRDVALLVSLQVLLVLLIKLIVVVVKVVQVEVVQVEVVEVEVVEFVILELEVILLVVVEVQLVDLLELELLVEVSVLVPLHVLVLVALCVVLVVVVLELLVVVVLELLELVKLVLEAVQLLVELVLLELKLLDVSVTVRELEVTLVLVCVAVSTHPLNVIECTFMTTLECACLMSSRSPSTKLMSSVFLSPSSHSPCQSPFKYTLVSLKLFASRLLKSK